MKKRINSRTKGANGEREAAQWIQERFNLEHTPQRNLEQVRYKSRGRIQRGDDLVGFEPFCIEVKRCETLALRDWWIQAKQAALRNGPGSIPVVMYRQNRRPWRFLISARAIGVERGYIMLEAREFVLWAQAVLRRVAERNSNEI